MTRVSETGSGGVRKKGLSDGPLIRDEKGNKGGRRDGKVARVTSEMSQAGHCDWFV